MKHLSQDELVLQFYREAGERVSRHLAGCPQCRSAFEELSETLAAISMPEPPTRSPDYGTQVWNQIRAHLPEKADAIPWWAVPRRWAAVATVAALVAVAFVAGRYTGRPVTAVHPANDSQLPQKVLVVALGDYLDRSEMLLVEVSHANRPEDLDLESQRRSAGELVAANRLYRQTAQRVGDTTTDALLEQLERVLLQVAHTPQAATDSDVQEIRQQLESGGLLFKIRVAQVNLKAEAGAGRSAPAQPQARPTI